MRSKWGPPGTWVIPKHLAVLSKASPMESSMVLPRMWCRPIPRVRTAMLWPPDTKSVMKGKAGSNSGKVSPEFPSTFAALSSFFAVVAGGSLVTRVCASMWCTLSNGSRCLAAICRAFLTPTSRHIPNPGPTVTATADKSSGLVPARFNASSTVVSMAFECASCASFGTTPPHWLCIPAWEARASPNILPVPERIAAPVSSQLDSMPSTFQSAGLAGRGFARVPCMTEDFSASPEGASSWSALPCDSSSASAASGCGTAPTAFHAATMAGHLGPMPVRVTLRPSAWGPNPANVMSNRGG
mmetsp:Transcript_5162/g.12400  ORF Transcript_5162/g.12400 Transcript_5162/m.12400 type:complete len:299 (+) Transcript_5162:734-1630(+)